MVGESLGTRLLLVCLVLVSCHTSLGKEDANGIQTIKEGIKQIGLVSREQIQERQQKFRDTAGNVYDVVRDASGMATNFVKDKAGAVYDVAQMAGEFLLDSIESYPEEMVANARESMNSLVETAKDVNEAMSEIGSAAREAIPELPPIKKMNQPKAWLQKLALNNLYFQKYIDTVGDQFQSLSEGLSAKYCKAPKITPSKKLEGELTSPSFKLKLITKQCDVMYSHFNGTKLNCTKPGISFEKVPGHYIAKHHSPVEFKSKECKFEKEHGATDSITLFEFNGLETFDFSSVMKTVEKSMVSAFSESGNVPKDAEEFMKLLPELADVEAETLDMLTSGLPEVEL